MVVNGGKWLVFGKIRSVTSLEADVQIFRNNTRETRQTMEPSPTTKGQ